ncbi:MAG: DUF6600 domain-containing protein [Bryobacteraceae bacterium]
MRRLTLLLLPAALFAGQARYARLGDFDGQAEVQLEAAEGWMAAERNLPLPESTWLRTGAESRLEIELDEGSAWRLGPDSQCALADYTRLSTGQRVTLLWLDRGLAYFTGEPEGRDALTLAVPGAQIVLTRGARVRLEVRESWSRISVIEGVVRFSSPAAEMDLREGQTTRVEPSNPARFFLDREIARLDLDEWSEGRDKALASPVSAAHVLQRYGLVDLDAAGEWIQTGDLGAVWQPKEQDGWIPYRDGRWRWYGALGYAWVSDEPWGWLPYHYGRWTRKDKLGWVWAPAAGAVFKPAEVYWMRGDKLAGWGPLAPGEEWNGSDMPAEFLNSNTTFAAFAADARAIDPAGFTERPKEPLKAAAFTLALPSPSFPAARLEATRPLLVSSRTRVLPAVTGGSFESPGEIPTESPTPPPAPAVLPPPAAVAGGTAPQDPPTVVVNPLSVILLTPPGQPAPAKSAPSSTASASASASSATTTSGDTNRRHAPPPKQEPTKTNPPGRRFRDGEFDLYREVRNSFNANDFARALTSLNTWAERFPHTDFEAERQFDYVQAFDGTGQSAKVLETANTLLAQGLATALPDARQALTVLYLASLNLQKISRPTRAQIATGQQAAHELLLRLPDFFVPGSRPASTTEAQWRKMRQDLETVANGTLALAERHRAAR